MLNIHGVSEVTDAEKKPSFVPVDLDLEARSVLVDFIAKAATVIQSLHTELRLAHLDIRLENIEICLGAID